MLRSYRRQTLGSAISSAELEKSPNGWPLCKMVGAEYINSRVYKRMRNE